MWSAELSSELSLNTTHDDKLPSNQPRNGLGTLGYLALIYVLGGIGIHACHDSASDSLTILSLYKFAWRIDREDTLERTGVYNWFTVNKFTDDQCDPPNNIDMTQLTHDQWTMHGV